MSAHLPPAVAKTPLFEKLRKHLPLFSRGKVRDTFALSDYSNLLLPVASDRISIFDFVLNAEVWSKGIVLNSLSRFWMRGLVLTTIPNHLVAEGRDIDGYLPSPLRGIPELQARAQVVRRLNMLPVECVARGYLTGSGWDAYQKTGAVCGIKLPPGLHDGSKLPALYFPLFTPTSKAETGHDEPLDAGRVAQIYGCALVKRTAEIYQRIHDYSLTCGIIFADTKFEFGEDPNSSVYVLADEIGTPDSSRFWDRPEWDRSQAENPPHAPAGWDKQPVREWGKTVVTPFGVTGINKLTPGNPEHEAFVDSLVVPAEVVNPTSRRYQAAFRRLVGMDVFTYLDAQMNVRLPAQAVTV